MSEHDEPEAAETEEDVEAHGLKEAAITGLSAAALIAGAGDAIAATTPGHAAVTSKQAVHKIDAAHKGAAIHKDAMWKGAAVQKDATRRSSAGGSDLKRRPIRPEAGDPTIRDCSPTRR